jgi:hypothetical protein
MSHRPTRKKAPLMTPQRVDTLPMTCHCGHGWFSVMWRTGDPHTRAQCGCGQVYLLPPMQAAA